MKYKIMVSSLFCVLEGKVGVIRFLGNKSYSLLVSCTRGKQLVLVHISQLSRFIRHDGPIDAAAAAVVFTICQRDAWGVIGVI